MGVKRRMCGTRKPGKIYVVVEEERLPYDMTWIDFLVDPPSPIDADLVSAQGVTALPRVLGYDQDLKVVYARDQGKPIMDFYDWVGAHEYPDVALFIEEVFRQGVSRLTPRTTQFGDISRKSEYRLIHPKAVISEPGAHWRNRIGVIAKRMANTKFCVRHIEEHDEPNIEAMEYYPVMCASLYWEDITKPSETMVMSRECKIKLADGELVSAATPPAGANAVDRSPGVFMRFPMSAFVDFDVIRDPEEHSHESALEILRALKGNLKERVRLANE